MAEAVPRSGAAAPASLIGVVSAESSSGLPVDADPQPASLPGDNPVGGRLFSGGVELPAPEARFQALREEAVRLGLLDESGARLLERQAWAADGEVGSTDAVVARAWGILRTLRRRAEALAEAGLAYHEPWAITAPRSVAAVAGPSTAGPADASSCDLSLESQMARLALAPHAYGLPVDWHDVLEQKLLRPWEDPETAAAAAPEEATAAAGQGFQPLQPLGPELVRSLLYHLGITGSKTSLAECGWRLVTGVCIGEGNEGHCLSKNLNELTGKVLADVDTDKVLISINLAGNAHGVAPRTCALTVSATDDEEDKAQNFAMKRDIAALRNGSFDPASAASTGSWTTRAGRTHKVYGGLVDEFSRIVAHPVYERWLSIASSAECDEIVFNGFSLGAAVGQLARIDIGEVDAAGHYTGRCLGKRCRYLGMAGWSPFYGEPGGLPTLAGARDSEPVCPLGEQMWYAEGDGVPPFPNHNYFEWPIMPSWYKEGWSTAVPQEVIREFTSLVGLHQVQLRRDLHIPLVGLPFAVVSRQAVPCQDSAWRFYRSRDWEERMAAVENGTLAGLTRQRCKKAPMCGHHEIDVPFLVDFASASAPAPASEPGSTVPMPPGSALYKAHALSKVPLAILQTLLNV